MWGRKEIKLETQVAFISDNPGEQLEIHELFGNLNHVCICYDSDAWERLVEVMDEYGAILIDLHLGGGLLAVEVSRQLIMSGYDGRIILLAGETLRSLNQRYATVLMMDRVKNNPSLVFKDTDISDSDMMAETAMLTQTICKRRN